MIESTLGLEHVPAGRKIYANRTLNLRTIGAIGYDMDYTLVHYHADVWEQKAYERAKDLLRSHRLRVLCRRGRRETRNGS